MIRSGRFTRYHSSMLSVKRWYLWEWTQVEYLPTLLTWWKIWAVQMTAVDTASATVGNASVTTGLPGRTAGSWTVDTIKSPAWKIEKYVHSQHKWKWCFVVILLYFLQVRRPKPSRPMACVTPRLLPAIQQPSTEGTLSTYRPYPVLLPKSMYDASFWTFR